MSAERFPTDEPHGGWMPDEAWAAWVSSRYYMSLASERKLARMWKRSIVFSAVCLVIAVAPSVILDSVTWITLLCGGVCLGLTIHHARSYRRGLRSIREAELREKYPLPLDVRRNLTTWHAAQWFGAD